MECKYEETTVGGERIFWVGIGGLLLLEKKLGSLEIPDLDCIFEGEGEPIENGEEQKFISINNLGWNGKRFKLRRWEFQSEFDFPYGDRSWMYDGESEIFVMGPNRV